MKRPALTCVAAKIAAAVILVAFAALLTGCKKSGGLAPGECDIRFGTKVCGKEPAPVVAPAPDFKPSADMVAAMARIEAQDNRIYEVSQPASASLWVSIQPRPDGKRYDGYAFTICKMVPNGHSVVIHLWDAEQMSAKLVDIGYFYCNKK